MNEHNNFSPSDLIYLFLDGEVSAVQKTMLFSALAHDSELQAEFQEALLMQQAAEHEAQSVLPPTALRESLFEKAGFVAIAETTPHAVSVGAALSVFFLHWKNFVLPFAGAVAGSAVTMLAYILFQGNMKKPELAVSGAPIEYGKTFSTHGDMGNSGQSVHSLPIPPARSASAGIYSSRQTMNPGVHMQAPAQAVPERLESPIARRAEALLSVSPISPVASPLSPIIHEQNVPVSVSGQLTPEFDFLLSFQIRGIRSMAFYPNRPVYASSSFLNDIAAGVYYSFNEHSTIGIEAGRETFPLYVENTPGALESTSSLTWAGSTFGWTPGALGTLAPFARMIAGGSQSGPVMKSLIGLNWAPEQNITFSLGAEGTVLVYRYKSVWHTTEKIGVSYGMSIHL